MFKVNLIKIFFVLTISIEIHGIEFELKHDEMLSKEQLEDEVVQKLYTVIEHFKNDNPIGLPIAPIPDPMDVPDQSLKLTAATMKLNNAKIYGLKNFKIQEISSEVKEMKAKCRIIFDSFQLLGNYSLSSFFTKSKGPFTISITNVIFDGDARLEVRKDGNLRTQSINCDLSYGDMKMNFENLGGLGALFQSVANSAKNIIFDSVKPKLLAEVTAQMTQEVDKYLESFLVNVSLPNSLSPVDKFIYDFRTEFREMKYDPYQIEDYVHSGLLGVKVYNIWLFGLSSFYRLGELSFKITDNVATITMNVGTQKIHGSGTWQVSIARGMITRTGSVQFSVQHIKVMFQVSQPLDLRKKLKFDDLQIDLGNIQIRSNGLGTADYLIEFFVNVFPNLLRYQIVDALEKPILRKLQDYTDQIDMESLIKHKFLEYRQTGTINMNLKEEL